MLTAVATNDAGTATTSGAIGIKVDAPPTVSLSAPTNNAIYAAPGNIALSATAAVAVGAIAKVDFYKGATLIGTATASPYTFTWTNVAAGNYSLTAVATNDAGAATTSGAISIQVDAPPTVSLAAPVSGAVYATPGNITLTAAAADAVGTITRVDFYQGTTLIGTATSAPYTFSWTSVAAGSYSLTAVATNDAGMSATSGAIAITVDAPPVVSLTSPTSGASFTAPATVTLTAAASDAVGTIARVDFYQGTTLIGSATASPYSFSWANVPQGSYTLTAVATNDAGMTTSSAAIAITVRSAVAQMYYIAVDHLNTPRLIADSTGTTVWRWDNQEPFGNDVPNSNPSGAGAFDFPLRFPGQYFDRETNLAYNYFRDYDPAVGRYIQSDLVGLVAGLNTYNYVTSNPLRYADPLGLDETIWDIRGARGLSDGPRNGNWCGKNWSGGWIPSLHGGMNGSLGPSDSLDDCCRAHDLCWDRCEPLKGDPKRYHDCRNRCNRDIVKCGKDLNPDCTKWPQPPRTGTEGDSDTFRDDTIRYWADEVRKYESRVPK